MNFMSIFNDPYYIIKHNLLHKCEVDFELADILL